MTKFEYAVKATMTQACMGDMSAVTDEAASIYAHELMKAAIQQLRDDGNIVNIINPVD